ncbi:hypothetical protein LCGC14_0576630 [marine sediment metagenome]|uniref:Uncharacterized protein n=1 Tax=marine sediment metagenome TaxID=412755 RepID=A0A0F9RMP3_9ZZZZ|nr:MAG: hypothetical protein Lokiarch_01890 [Candidatus Lokiarchaeum sp. GC14_75]HEC39573.1 hypothetical protein [bacterium]
MIENLWILIKGGILVFSKNYIKLKVTDDNLIAGFLSALGSFVKETTNEEIKSISMEGRKFSYIVGDGLIIVISTNQLDNDILVFELLKDIKSKFLEKYMELIGNFLVDTDNFKNFDTELEEILTKSDISINCRTCKKSILGEFRIKHMDSKKIYFCCPLCEENFLVANK